MITLCVVSLELIEKYFEKQLLATILAKTTLIDEVLIASVEKSVDFLQEWQIDKIRFKKFGCKSPSDSPGTQHAFGMHQCIDRARNDLIYLCDPDVLFYMDVPKFYHQLMMDYNLDIIGCSHKQAIEYACGYYPNQINAMFRKSKIPNLDFLNQDLKEKGFKLSDLYPPNDKNYPGLWLMPGPILKYADLFPNREGQFETGCNLWLIGKLFDWKWLSFQTTDCVTYTTQFYKGNIKPLPKLKKEKLVYHCNNGNIIAKEVATNNHSSGMLGVQRYNNFLDEFNKIMNEEN